MSDQDGRDRLSLIGHAEMPLCNPLSLEELDSLLAEQALEELARVLDLGAGRGDVGLRCARLQRTSTTLVDRSAIFVAEAALRARAVPGVEIIQEDITMYLEREPEDVALAICLGATHAFGGIDRSAHELATTLRAGGAMLIGDLVALGPRAASAFDIPEHATLRLAGVAREVIVGPDRMRAYEDAWSLAVLRHLDAHPDDPGASWARARIDWMRANEGALEELAFAAWLVRADEPIQRQPLRRASS